MTKTATIHSVGFRTGKTAEDLRVRTENYLARGAHISPVPVKDAITAWECLLNSDLAAPFFVTSHPPFCERLWWAPFQRDLCPGLVL